jgi:protein-S-isoprenylcysteine O-methyltransferase Ste14
MVPLITTDQTARIMLQVTAIAFAVSEVSIRIRSARRSAGLRADRGSILAVVLSIGAGLLVAIWCAASVSLMAIPGDWTPLIVGIALMWLGIALREWAVLALGIFFTVVVRVAPEQTVVDRGPYRWVRHPSYTGLLLTLIGLGLALGNWLSLLALAVLPTIGLVIRIRVEEQALLSVLGDRYRGYAEHRPRLIPGIW